ncbi:hypothetical protein M408DRAFT_156977 [Serendipita vermifera MAFF 305830]|uniref:Uncharacterized protein n=1 Tax=Serendipita vermifera MAFF 305830 TaxID=933852 RepID=A0A0C2X638_SERVB|nr:hypothetical protein M408DRAFT_156977 [Serendipita vermifera MAFF 305830]
MPKEAELKAPAAPSMMGGTNATSSSIDLTNDPYAVPPLPPQRNMPYHDDPSGSAVFYDPYRGPVPHTFTSPPPSTDGGHNNSAYGRGEAIPMSTYPSSSGRQSPGPNAAYDDPYARSGSPGPNAAYGGAAVDPYGARSRSPGPGMAYDADPYAAGRRSPGPALAYGGGGGPAGYDPSVRMGTPVGAGPGRVGTPLGAGPGRVGTPVGAGGYGVDMMRTATPLSYRGPSPAPPAPGGGGYGAQPMHDPYGRYTPNPYGQ